MHVSHQSCFECDTRYGRDETVFQCRECGGSLLIVYEDLPRKKHISSKSFREEPPGHWKYWSFYPVGREGRVSMREGSTPLIESEDEEGFLFKIEGENPTGSFKDRGSTVEISHARQLGVDKVVCASTGNMGASVAAYAARADIEAEIWLPEDASGTKIDQIEGYGAEVVREGETYNETVQSTLEFARKGEAYLTGDYTYRLEGQKSVAFEILDQLDWSPPDYLVVPVGMGTLCFSAYKALAELKALDMIDGLPEIVAVQAEGCAPVVRAFRQDAHEIERWENPETVAGAIECDLPNYGHEVLHALKKTGGKAVSVSDEEIMDARKRLGDEGIYAEPAGAAAYAGALGEGLDGRVVCVVTGSGLKDPRPGR